MRKHVVDNMGPYLARKEERLRAKLTTSSETDVSGSVTLDTPESNSSAKHATLLQSPPSKKHKLDTT